VNGNLIWSKQVGTSGGYTYGRGITIDYSGNVYVTGYTNIGISGQKQNGSYDYFIAKYDMNGNLIWSKQVGALGGYTYGQGITADNTGNIYVTGSTNVGISGQIQTGLGDYFIAKYDTLGNLIWTKQVGASGGGAGGKGITTDNNGNIYVTGSTNVGLSGQVQNGFNDYFIARYDINGNFIWSRQVGAYFGNTFGTGISTDSSGNIYITGWTTVGISGQKQNGRNDYFVAKYDQYGLAWTTQVGTAGGNTYGYGINTDISGNIYVAGSTDIGISGQIQNGSQNYFIAKYIN
jgi:outer membrane protein assembly factor BamB